MVNEIEEIQNGKCHYQFMSLCSFYGYGSIGYFCCGHGTNIKTVITSFQLQNSCTSNVNENNITKLHFNMFKFLNILLSLFFFHPFSSNRIKIICFCLSLFFLSIHFCWRREKGNFHSKNTGRCECSCIEFTKSAETKQTPECSEFRSSREKEQESKNKTKNKCSCK